MTGIRGTEAMMVLSIVAVSIVAFTIGGSPVAAQEREEVTGTADFRNPPRLENGNYSDTIVSGESLWYEVLYTNDTQFEFSVGLEDVDVEARDELSLVANFVGPTLGSVESGVELAGSASYTGGDTNVWYLEVVLETTGRRGLQHTLLIDVDGVESSTFETCPDDPACTLDEDLAALDNELVDLEQETAELVAVSGEELQAEIDALEAQATAVDAETSTLAGKIAELCHPEPDCEAIASPSQPPLWAMFVGGVTLLAGLGFLVNRVASRR